MGGLIRRAGKAGGTKGIFAMGIGGGAEEVFEYLCKFSAEIVRKERLLVMLMYVQYICTYILVQLLTTMCDPFDPRFASFRFYILCTTFDRLNCGLSLFLIPRFTEYILVLSSLTTNYRERKGPDFFCLHMPLTYVGR